VVGDTNGWGGAGGEGTLNERAIDTSYEPFSQEPEYLALNRWFIQSVVPHLDRCQRVLDLACGAGTLTELFIDILQDANFGGVTGGGLFPRMVLGIDISRESLKLAQAHLATLGSQVIVGLVEASADNPPVGTAAVDLILLGNAIHCFADKDALLRETIRVLRPGGIFAFNSSFYAGTIVPGTEEFYHGWLKASLEYIRQKDIESRQRGLGGITRVRGHGRPAFSTRWLSPSEYSDLLDRNGFEVKTVGERVYAMSQRNLESVGAYAGLAEVLLSGYPTAVACEALERSVGPAFGAVGVGVIHRSSLEIVAVKRGGGARLQCARERQLKSKRVSSSRR